MVEHKKKEILWALFFVAPAVLGFLLWNLIPIISSAVISFTDYIKLLNEELGTERREIPETKDEVLALIWSMEETGKFINEELTKGRLTARLSNISTSRGEEIRDKILDDSHDLLGNRITPLVTGSTLLALKTTLYLVKNLTDQHQDTTP